MQYKDKFFLNNSGYFIAPNVDIRPQINYQGKITPAKEIYVNADIPSSGYVDGQSPFPSKVQQIWVKEAGTPKLVWPLTSTFMIGNGGAATYGVEGDGPQRYAGVHFTVKRSDDTSNYVCFPVGWTGKISYWVSDNKNNTTTPSNTAVNVEQWYFSRGAYHQFEFWGGDDNGGIAENGRDNEAAQFTKDGWLEYGRNTPTKKMVIDKHIVTLKDKTSFTFNGYYNQSTPLKRPWFGFLPSGDGPGDKGNYFQLQAYRNLMIAVTTTSLIKPVVLPVFKGNITDAVMANQGFTQNNFVSVRLWEGVIRFGGTPNAWRAILTQNEKMNASKTAWKLGVIFDGIRFDADTGGEWIPGVTIGGVAMDTQRSGDDFFIDVPLPSPKDPRWITVKATPPSFYFGSWIPIPGTSSPGYRYMILPLDIIDPQGTPVLSLSNQSNLSLPMDVFIKVEANYI